MEPPVGFRTDDPRLSRRGIPGVPGGAQKALLTSNLAAIDVEILPACSRQFPFKACRKRVDYNSLSPTDTRGDGGLHRS